MCSVYSNLAWICGSPWLISPPGGWHHYSSQSPKKKQKQKTKHPALPLLSRLKSFSSLTGIIRGDSYLVCFPHCLLQRHPPQYSYWVSQKIHSSFSMKCHENTWMNLLANLIYYSLWTPCTSHDSIYQVCFQEYSVCEQKVIMVS